MINILRKQKLVVDDVIFEFCIYLYKINYLDEIGHEDPPYGWKDMKEKSINTIETIYDYYMEEFKKNLDMKEIQ